MATRSTERITIRWTPEEYARLVQHVSDMRRARAGQTGVVGVGTAIRAIVLETLGVNSAPIAQPDTRQLSILEPRKPPRKAPRKAPLKPPRKVRR